MTTFYMLIGLPASGKSTYIKEHFDDDIVFSSDKIREECFGDVNDQTHNNEVFKKLVKRVKANLRNKKDAVYDATNINYKRRMHLLKDISHLKVKKVAIFMATPYDICLKNNQQRDRHVPEAVINNMYRKFNVPYYYEGWDEIIVINRFKNRVKYSDLFNPDTGFDKYNQFSSNHQYTLGKHLRETFEYIKYRTNDIELKSAALLHDIGKPKTQVFANAQGEVDTEAHYYNHQYVGAYDSMFVESNCNTLKRAMYIMWHEQPRFINLPKTQRKYMRLWKENIYNNIFLLHNCDYAAH